MSFSLYYNDIDAQVLADAIQAAAGTTGLSGPDIALALTLWNAGLRNYKTAPKASPARSFGDPNVRELVVTTALHLSDLGGLLHRIVALLPPAQAALAGHAEAIAQDLVNTGREPYP